ncbi:hypothetical protein CRP01_27630 [Flavilitoribacter nigricans DSM 23189 = NBRC 102662]|uniref:Uncharacterized protein n=1 Tax=Flavilitoribacter nigricans (strain ATCC 23147 / DSM 23189 / NBRC 102662 / NCIMB 1420 / SS-2) TaxID=1122177 RepID=A0A2D0N4T4_FLAN2|nr:hypothetical protein CRP01_27630 [Flavilitoribacter nigricans DSM 23189 = NBRC 102662]
MIRLFTQGSKGAGDRRIIWFVRTDIRDPWGGGNMDLLDFLGNGRLGDQEIWRLGDGETGRGGDWEQWNSSE